MPHSNAAAVFIINPVEDMMATVLDTPMSTVGFENIRRTRFMGVFAGDAVSNLGGGFLGFFSELLDAQ